MLNIKVLVVSACLFFPENKDGTNKINYHIVKENPYYQADFLCLKTEQDQTLKKIIEGFDNIKINTINIKKSDSLKLFKKFTWFFSLNPFAVLRKKHLNKFKITIQKLADEYDVIHLSTLSFSPLLKLLPESITRKCILCPIDSPTLFYLRRSKKEKNFLKKVIWKLESIKNHFHEKEYYPLARKVLFVSEIDVDYTKTKHKNMNNIAAISVGVDTDYFSSDPKILEEETTMIYTGHFDYSPNIAVAEFLVEHIIPLVLEKMPNIKLYLVGGNPPDSLVKINSDTIKITGFVEDIRYYLQKAKLYVSPMFFGTGIKNKILEAMSMEKTIIGSPISFEGINPINGKECIILDSESPQVWADMIIENLRKDSTNQSIGINARKFVTASYSWDSIRNQYGMIYRQVAEENSRLKI